MSASHNMPWLEHPEVPDAMDPAPMRWDDVATYVLITASTMATLVLVLVGMAWWFGIL